MEIEYLKDRQPGEEVAATIYGCKASEDTGFGTGLKWLLVDTSGRSMLVFTPDTVTKRNRLGRIVVALTGELKGIDTDDLVGMTVTVKYISKKSDATVAVADLMVPRKPGKDEDVVAVVKAAQEAEAQRDDTSPF